jgi:hypothetical protein
MSVVEPSRRSSLSARIPHVAPLWCQSTVCCVGSDLFPTAAVAGFQRWLWPVSSGDRVEVVSWGRKITWFYFF